MEAVIMAAGRIWHDRQFRYTDPKSGREVVRLTDYLGHSHHLYFTDPCWIEDNRVFIFASDRENCGNLFSYNLRNGEIRQLTDFSTMSRPQGVFCQATMKHYFWHGTTLYELDVESLAWQPLYQPPAGFRPMGSLGPTADGRFVCALLVSSEAFSSAPRITYAYSRFNELFELKPLSRIVRINTADGQSQVLHEDRCYLGHINTSPTQSHLLTFCHEGPWDRVDQRI
jgi:oligogalacturonide lyase